MPYTPLKIRVPDPCGEDWNAMQPIPGSTARHCANCTKNVTDFTGFTDAQLHAYAREHRGKLCGRFRPDQINRPVRATKLPNRNSLRVAAATAGLLLASTGLEGQQAAAQPVPQEQVVSVQAEQQEKDNSLVQGAAAKTAKPGATGEKAQMETPDTLPLPDPDFHDTMIMGMIVVEPPAPTGMDLFLDSIKAILPPNTHPHPEDPPAYLENIVVSPNPFKDRLRLEINTPQTRTLRVALLDPLGRTVAAETFWRLPSGYHALVFRAKARKLKYGIYYLRITDEDNRRMVRTVIREAK